jgi:predicted nucleic acid-binding protein
VQSAIASVFSLSASTCFSSFAICPNNAGLVRRFPAVTAPRIEEFVTEILKIAVFTPSVPVVYTHPYDPDDSNYVNLAAATQSRLIVSRDRDLLNLMDEKRKEGREFRTLFPSLRIMDPPAFLVELRQLRQAPGRV